MIVAIVFGLVLNINRIEWIFILIAIALVLTVEALNTAIEYVVDLVTVEYHDLAKYAKDIAAFSTYSFNISIYYRFNSIFTTFYSVILGRHI